MRRKNGIFKKKEVKELNRYLQRRISTLKDKPKHQPAVAKDLWEDDSGNCIHFSVNY